MASQRSKRPGGGWVTAAQQEARRARRARHEAGTCPCQQLQRRASGGAGTTPVPAPLARRPPAAHAAAAGRAPAGAGADPAGSTEFLPFGEARAFVRALGLEGRAEWLAWCRCRTRPSNVPVRPQDVYKHGGWQDMAHWLSAGSRETAPTEASGGAGAGAASRKRARPTISGPRSAAEAVAAAGVPTKQPRAPACSGEPRAPTGPGATRTQPGARARPRESSHAPGSEPGTPAKADATATASRPEVRVAGAVANAVWSPAELRGLPHKMERTRHFHGQCTWQNDTRIGLISELGCDVRVGLISGLRVLRCAHPPHTKGRAVCAAKRSGNELGSLCLGTPTVLFVLCRGT